MNRHTATGILSFLALGTLLGCLSLPASKAQKQSESMPSHASHQATIVLKNGDMTLGQDIPGFWHHKWVGKGKIEISRDTQVFKRGPAALMVTSTSGPAKGQASQLIKASSGQSFTLRGFAKSAGTVKVNVAVQSLSKQLRPIKFQQVQYLQNNQDWTSFSESVTLPANTHRFRIVLLLEGQGQAWLDEVQLTGDGVKNIAGNPEKLPPPKKQDPTVPMRGYFPKYPEAWQNFHEMYLKQTRQRQIKVVFLGDSITRGWKNHKRLWQTHYGKHGAVNFGIGNDRTQQILWRIENGLFDRMQPQLVVLNIGVNNLWSDTYGTDRIAAGIEKIVSTIQTKSPNTKVLVLGILPTGNKPDTPLRRKIRAINAQSAQLDNGKTIRFLDIGSEFLDPNGYISKEIMPDYLHLSKKGYQIWADSMQADFNQILRE
mgnify:CR=1 FL=1